MARIVGKEKVVEFKHDLRRPMVKARSGEMVPDFREKNGTGMDVTDLYMENVVKDDVVVALRMINNFCPVAKVSHMSGASDIMTVTIANVQFSIHFGNCKVQYVQIELAQWMDRSKYDSTKYKTLQEVLGIDMIRNHAEYAIIKAKLQEQYFI